MRLDMTNWTDKASKNADERRIYEQETDYLRAYSKHTDLRIVRDGPAQAIGGDWNDHGLRQLRFHIARGLRPEMTLLDIGCGTGRFARRAVRYLDIGNYTGVDISSGAVNHALWLAQDEGWHVRRPRVLLIDGTLDAFFGKSFDRIWAHSVFTHLPVYAISRMFANISSMTFVEFCFTYKRRPKPTRTGLKQFGYPPEFFINLAGDMGMRCQELIDQWPQGQSCMKVWRD